MMRYAINVRRFTWNILKYGSYSYSLPARCMSKTTLYRSYNNKNELLYVGISHSVMARIGQHKNAGVWHGECVRITLEHFATRELAREAEAKAIKTEHPIYNKQGKPSGSDNYWKTKQQQAYAKFDQERKEKYGWKDIDFTAISNVTSSGYMVIGTGSTLDAYEMFSARYAYKGIT